MLHLEHGFVWCWNLDASGSRSETPGKWCWRRMEKISWTDHVRNEEVLFKSQGAEGSPTWNKNVECFKYLGSILTNDGRCTCEIKCRISMAKAALNKKRALFTSTLDLELRKKLVKCDIWSIVLYSAETWTLQTADQKHLKSF